MSSYAPADGARVSVFGTLTRAQGKAAVRDFTTLFFTFAFPLVFLVLFGSIFHSSTVEGTDKSYISYIAPGVLTWGVANAAVFAIAFALMMWRDSDLLRILRMTPTRISTLLASKFSIALGTAVVQSVLFVLVAMIPFFGLQPAATSWRALPLLALGVAVFFALGSVIGSLANTAESVAAISNVVMLPMAFLSGALFPLDMMPSWLQSIAHVFPLYWLNEGVSAAINGTGTASEYLAQVGVLGGYAVVFTVLATQVFRWSND